MGEGEIFPFSCTLQPLGYVAAGQGIPTSVQVSIPGVELQLEAQRARVRGEGGSHPEDAQHLTGE